MTQKDTAGDGSSSIWTKSQFRMDNNGTFYTPDLNSTSVAFSRNPFVARHYRGIKRRRKSVIANSYDRRIRTWSEGCDEREIRGEDVRYLHNVGKRRNSTAGGNDVLPYSRGHFHVEARGRRRARRNHFRLAEPEIRANLWAPVYMSISTLGTRIVTSIDV